MPYVIPATYVQLYQDCPLDSKYENTLWFDTESDQRTYFNSIVYPNGSFNAQSFQRTQKNTIRIAASYADFYDCNYVGFTNVNHGNKWYYAFVNHVEYINESTIEIQYTIDVIQTWMFAWRLDPCFIARMTTPTDEIGDNIEMENLDIGEDYVSNESGELSYISGTPLIVVVFLTTFNNDSSFSDFTGGYTNGTFTGLNIIHFESSNPVTLVSLVNDFLANVQTADKISGIVSAYCCDFRTTNLYGADTMQATLNRINTNTPMDGYVPRNKKLYTYPYHLLRVNTDTNSADYKFELFPDNYTNTYNFTIKTITVPMPTVTLYPNDYASITSGANTNYQYRLTLQNYPQIAFNTDVWKVYIAQRQSSVAVGMISNVAQSAISGGMSGGAQGALLGAGITAAKETANFLAQRADMKRLPPQVNGSQTGDIDYVLGTKKFRWHRFSIRHQILYKLDDYFSMYGYAYNRKNYPLGAIAWRPYWYYVQTVGCEVHGNVPASDKAEIANVFNNGIRFWKSPTNFCNYNLDNSPTSP